MSRRRWVQINGELVEVTEDYQQSFAAPNQDHVLWNDRIYQDGGDQRFTSRSQHREYMRMHGLTTMDDYHGQWREAERKRIEYGAPSEERKRDMIEAIHKLGG